MRIPRPNWPTLRRSVPIRFCYKAFNDWIFDLAGMLAYYLLLATVPIFLLLIGGVGLVLRGLRPGTEAKLVAALEHTLPLQISSNIIVAVTDDLKQSSGVLLLVGLVAALFFGSRLIVRMDDCMTIIYREQPRHVLGQQVVALGLTLLFVLLAPVMFLAAAIPSLLATTVVQQLWHVETPGIVGHIAGFVGAFLAAFLWLLAIYLLVPSRHVGWRNSWLGAALAALFLIVYELLFPWIASALIRPGKYGETAGFLLILLSFFYYFAFLLLLGAEVNSWLAGYRETPADVPTLLHQAIIHRRFPEPPEKTPPSDGTEPETPAGADQEAEASPASQDGHTGPDCRCQAACAMTERSKCAAQRRSLLRGIHCWPFAEQECRDEQTKPEGMTPR
ncbi:MAG TPA: YihY/virulence factor BrkB family protein [Ktedonobacterales bacterium]|nr:YihY/virulence factor BrkB family protein [Ktedonobacterales bacterium]